MTIPLSTQISAFSFKTVSASQPASVRTISFFVPKTLAMMMTIGSMLCLLRSARWHGLALTGHDVLERSVNSVDLIFR
jgi:hypothetical protein